MKKTGNSLLRDMIPAVLLVLGILSIIYVYREGTLFGLLSRSMDYREASAAVRDTITKLGGDPREFDMDITKKTRTVEVELETDNPYVGPDISSGNFIRFVQTRELTDDQALSLPFFIWHAVCTTDRGDSTAQAVFAFAPSGRLLFMEHPYGLFGKPAAADTSGGAEDAAASYLGMFTDIDPGSLELSESGVAMINGVPETTLSYVWADTLGVADVGGNVTIVVREGRVRLFAHKMTVDDVTLRVGGTSEGVNVDLPESSSERFSVVSGVVLTVIAVVCWIITILVAIVYFILKMKRDEVDFVRGLYFGGAVFLGMFILVASNTYDFVGMLVGGGFAGLFIGGLMVFAFSTGESLTREVWSEKLRNLDVLIQGKFLVRQVGDALISGMGLAGVLLLLIVPGISYTLLAPQAWHELSERFFMQSDLRMILNAFSSWILWITMILSLFVLTASSFLRKRIRSLPVATIALAFLYLFAGYTSLDVKPDYLRFTGFIPAALFFAYCVFRVDTLTIIFITAFFVFFGVQFPNFLMREGDSALVYTVVFTAAAALYMLGVYVRRTGTDADAIEEYVPEYLTRLAEKERIHRELEIARKYQRQLLPSATPEYESATVSAMCVPASEVGGDYYDYFPHGDNRLGVIIGDVSGKGVPAAFSMTMVKGIVKTLAEHHDSPRDILTHLNKVFSGNVAKGVFISSIYAVFDFSNCMLHFSRAGHVPLIIWRGEEKIIEKCLPSGIAVGLDRGTIFDREIEEREIPVKSGDIILLYTDGISEAANSRGEDFGEERLEALIERNAEEEPHVLLDRIYNAVIRFSGKTGYRDDITAVAVKIQ